MVENNLIFMLSTPCLSKLSCVVFVQRISFGKTLPKNNEFDLRGLKSGEG
jgi:hypothetical protein